MRLLDRYLIKNFLKIFSLTLGAFSGIYLLVEFFEKIDDFIEHNASLDLYLGYFLWKIPVIFGDITPMAVLLTVFLTLGGLSKHGELTAMRACGIGLSRIARPLLLLALGVSILLLAGGDLLVPIGAREANRIMRTEVRGRAPMALKRDMLWFREDSRIIFIRLAVPEENLLYDLTIYELDDSFKLRRRIDAPRAAFKPDAGWSLQQAVLHQFDPSTPGTEVVKLRQLDYPLAKTPADFHASEISNQEVRFSELLTIARQLEIEGYDATRFRVDLHNRIAAPFTCLVMAFLGIPFALQRHRGSSLAIGIGISVAIGISYFLLQASLVAFGYAGALPPWAAAWSGNLLIGMLGVWMLLSTRQ